jgi:hypothetical protein
MQNIVNGVDRDAIFATIDAIKQDAGVAAFEFRVENEWVGGGYNRTTIRDFHGAHQDVAHDQVFEVYNDEPPVLLSGDKGPNPVENLLHALAGCLTTSIVYHAAAQGKKVDAVRQRLQRHPRGVRDRGRPQRRGQTGADGHGAEVLAGL